MKHPGQKKVSPDSIDEVRDLRSVQTVVQILSTPKEDPGKKKSVPEYHNPYKGMKV